MWANKNFIILAIAYALIYGVYCAVGTSMSNLLNPFGYSPTDIAIAGGSSLLSGVIAALAVGCFLDYTALYRKTHITISLVTSIFILVLLLTLVYSDTNVICLVSATVLLGASSVSFFPASLSYGAELTFPLQPALVNAWMNFLG